MAVKYTGTGVHGYPGVPRRDIDDAELKEIAAGMEMTRAQLVKLLTQDKPRTGPLYEKVGNEELEDPQDAPVDAQEAAEPEETEQE